MKSATIAMSSVGLMAMAPVCDADSTTTLRVSAQVIRHCTASLNGATDCLPETLRAQSSYGGTVTVKTVNGSPAIRFVGPQPSVEQDQNTIIISF